MGRNVEIKAVVAEPESLRRSVAAIADSGPTILRQTDTFFDVAAGRLKLRESEGHPAELIFYARPDRTQPAGSVYLTASVPDPGAFRHKFGDVFGIRGVVIKDRALYMVGRTRVHLDHVEGLGDFMELEVVLEDREKEPVGILEADTLRRQLGVSDRDLVDGAYIDLIERLQR